jgi:hypothetical protein
MVWNEARRKMPGRARRWHGCLIDVAVEDVREVIFLYHGSPQRFFVHYGVRIEFNPHPLRGHLAQVDLRTKYPLVAFLVYLQLSETYLVPMGL